MIRSFGTLLLATTFLTACGGGSSGGGSGGSGGSGGGGASTNPAGDGIGYSGDWALRGSGVDGPRGVAVDPWDSNPQGSAAFQTVEAGRLGFSSQDPLAAINAFLAYGNGLDGGGVVIAIVDSGVDQGHAEFAGRLVGGFNAGTGSTTDISGAAGAGDHGTHVAGIAAGAKNDSGSHGVAFDADIFSLKIFNDAGNYVATNTLLAAGIDAGVAADARIFNNSWGYVSGDASAPTFLENSSVIRTAIDNAIQEGSVFVWSAGNSYDAADGAFSVNDLARAAMNRDARADSIAGAEWAEHWVSVINLTQDNSGNWVIANASSGNGAADIGSNVCGVTMNYCIGAPGTFIYAALPGGGFGYKSGTSMAAPTVSGAIAVMFQAFPYVSSEEVLDQLFATADDLGVAGVDAVYGHGMINLGNALSFQGTVPVLASTSTVSGGGANANETTLVAPTAMARMVSQATDGMIVLDSFGRAFGFDSSGLISESTSLAIQNSAITADASDVVFSAAQTGRGFQYSLGSDVIDEEVVVSPEIAFTFKAAAQDAFTGDSAAVSLGVTHSTDTSSVSAYVGQMQEQNAVFGQQATGGFGYAEKSTTQFVGVRGETAVSSSTRLFGQVEIGQTQMQAASHSLIKGFESATSAYAQAGIAITGAAVEGDELTLMVESPLQMISGSGQIFTPVGRALNGVVLAETVEFDVGDLRTRPIVSAAYATTVGTDARISIAAETDGQESGLSAQWERAF